MKYLYIGGGILLVLLALSILSGIMISGCVDTARAELVQAVEEMDGGDFSLAVTHGTAAAKEWESHKNLLSALLSHEELDEISTGFSDLRSYAVTRTEEEYRARCLELEFRLEHIAEMDVPFYYNFL